MDDDSDRGPGRAARRSKPDHACPHVNANDVRCGSRFSLGRLEQAFSVCFGSYHGCPMYHRLNGEETSKRHNVKTSQSEGALARLGPPPRAAPGTPHTAPWPEVTITAHGRSIPLRPTGT